MAKYRHRFFEMYELRDEAIQSLSLRGGRPATEATAPETWSFAHLDVARDEGVIHVLFKTPQTFQEGTGSDLREDLTRLADLLGRDSKVLLDFTDVEAFNAASIRELVQFHMNLQTKGSRLALCCLAPATRESFFVT